MLQTATSKFSMQRTYRTVRRFIASKQDVHKISRRSEPVELAYASYEATSFVENHPAPIVVVHGLLGSKANWNRLAKMLLVNTSPQRKVYVVDTRNHGDSPHSQSHRYEDLAADIGAFCERFRIGKACLVGHSMGGLAAAYFALTKPDFVEKLITVDVSPVSANPIVAAMPAILKQLSEVQFPKQGNLASAKRDVDRQLSTMMLDPGLRLYVLMNVVQDENGRFKWRVNLSSLIKNLPNITRFPDLGGKIYNGPALFVSGEKSTCLRKRDHVDIQKLFPQAEFRTIASAGHWCHTDKPEEFVRYTADFLNTQNKLQQ